MLLITVKFYIFAWQHILLLPFYSFEIEIFPQTHTNIRFSFIICSWELVIIVNNKSQ